MKSVKTDSKTNTNESNKYLSKREEMIAKTKYRLAQRKDITKPGKQAGISIGKEHDGNSNFAYQDNQIKYRDTTLNEEDAKNDKSGLQVELHPMLRDMARMPQLEKGFNPLLHRSNRFLDSGSINPYLDQSNFSNASFRKPRALEFNTQGVYISKANELRKRLKKEQEVQDHKKILLDKGLLFNESLDEGSFLPKEPPLVEWWDVPYLKDRNYDKISDPSRIVLDNQTAPVTHFIQHPVLEDPIWESSSSSDISLFLTKKERKKIRRNNRLEKLKEKQIRIKLGLQDPDPPKIKVSNLMNVLTNESIKDPTAVEKKVRKEAQERIDNHFRINEERKLSKEQRILKQEEKVIKDLKKGYFTAVFKIGDLSNPQHNFKININAKQLSLVGICLKNPNFNLIIVQGGEKSIKFYKKLLTSRIEWNIYSRVEDMGIKETKIDIGKSNANYCKIIWEGQIDKLDFQKWSFMYSNDEHNAIETLKKFNCDHFWRKAYIV